MERRDHVQHDEVAIGVTGRITTRTWTPKTLRSNIKAWPILESDKERLKKIRELDDHLAESVSETTNIPVDGLLSFIADGLDPTSSKRAEASHLAVGTGTTDPRGSDTTLDTEVYRTIVGDAETSGKDLITSTYLSQTEANGHTITEIGLCGGPAPDGTLLTRALLGPGRDIEKKSGMIATIDYILELRRSDQ